MNRAFCLLLLSAAASAQQYVISTVAGGVPLATPVPAASVSIGDPPRIALDRAGNVYFGSQHSIYRVDRAGMLLRIAGTGRAGVTGDGGPALSAQLNYPGGIAIDAAGNIFYGEWATNSIRRISTAGVITAYPVDRIAEGEPQRWPKKRRTR